MKLNQGLLSVLIFFLVFSAKKLFIYNEEGLVLLCFVGFIAFAGSYFGDSITDFFVERRKTIQTELENFLELKETYLAEYEGILRSLGQNKAILTALEPICTQELNKLISSREQSLSSVCSTQVQEKLKALNYSRKMLEERLQITIALGFRESVLEAFQFSKQKLKLKLIREALQAFKKS